MPRRLSVTPWPTKINLVPVKRLSRLRSTAYHEAGHAMAGHLLGVPFRYLTIKSDGTALGRVQFRPSRLINADTFDNLSPRRRDLVERRIIVSLAGPEAQRLVTGRYDRRGGAGDLDTAMDLITRTGHSEGGSAHYYKWLQNRAYCLVASNGHRLLLDGIARDLLSAEC